MNSVQTTNIRQTHENRAETNTPQRGGAKDSPSLSNELANINNRDETNTLNPTAVEYVRDLSDTILIKEKLKNIILQLEADIADKTWLEQENNSQRYAAENDNRDTHYANRPAIWWDSNNNYSQIDIKLMPALINQANKKYPEMNLKFITIPDLPVVIKNTIEEGVESSMFITKVLYYDKKTHFGVIDYKYINGKTSLILFEPTHCNRSMGVTLKAVPAISKCALPDIHFCLAEMNIQRGLSESGIFSLALAKKLYIEKDKLLKLHQDHINDKLYAHDEAPFLRYDKLDKYLPVTFYKHTQSETRLKEYLDRNEPQERDAFVNKKNENILQRFHKNQSVVKIVEESQRFHDNEPPILTEGESIKHYSYYEITTTKEKSVSISIHKKRITEYKALLEQ